MPTPLNAREVCQRLRDAALGVCPLRRTDVCPLRRTDEPCGSARVTIDIDGWRLALDLDGPRLLHCLECRSADGRTWRLDTSQRFGTDPVSLLSTWELEQIERLLAE